MAADAEGNPLRPEHFKRYDESPDPEFYAQPRLVTHIDDAAIAAAGAFYARVLPAGGKVLDLMTSWVSHLPDASRYTGVAGLGMNAEELAANPQLTEWVVHDLNANPVLPWADGEFAGAIVTVSVQYLTRPGEVFREVGRVLREGAPFVVTYSNRCFPTKAVADWQMLDDQGHAELIGLYFRMSGAFGPVTAYNLSPNPGRSDPLYAVVAHAAKAPAGNEEAAEG